MLLFEMKSGEGLGNQLARYVTTRVIAKDNGYEFGTINPQKFKGFSFMKLDFGKKIVVDLKKKESLLEKISLQNVYIEKQTLHPENGAEIRLYDENLPKVKDNTLIDGIMQDEKYFAHKKNEIKDWLKVDDKYKNSEYSTENICVINFRGGEYVRHKELFLSKKYWLDAIENMRKINRYLEFIVVTDDVPTAKRFFPDTRISHESIGSDYSIINNAYYLILSNSSFAFFPAWLNEKVKMVIAPKYWARHNVSDGYWSCGYNMVRGWMYQDRNGNLSDYETCEKEFNLFREKNKDLFDGTRVYRPTLKTCIYLFIKNKVLPKFFKQWLKKLGF